MVGLANYGLIGNYSMGGKNDLKTHAVGDAIQIYFTPSLLGIELFLWAFGDGKHLTDYFSAPDFKPDLDSLGIKIIPRLEEPTK